MSPVHDACTLSPRGTLRHSDSDVSTSRCGEGRLDTADRATPRGPDRKPGFPSLSSHGTFPLRTPFALLLAVLLSLLAGCSEPLPPDRSAYAGLWRAENTSILITEAGRVEYVARRDNGLHKSIKAPLQRFEGDNFIVGVGPFKTTFVVSRPPHQEDGEWKMTVDGVALTRSR